MKKNDLRPHFVQQAGACALIIGSIALAGDSDAATAAGTANATVVESVSVSISAPPTPLPAGVGTIPVLSGTLFTLKSFTGSLSTNNPLLRFGSTPPPGAVVTAAEGETGAGTAPSTANSATVNVTRNADGSLVVSAGSGLTFAVSRPGAGVVNIEYN